MVTPKLSILPFLLFPLSPLFAADREIACRFCRVNVFVNEDNGNRQEFVAVYSGDGVDRIRAQAFASDWSMPRIFDIERSGESQESHKCGVLLKAKESTYSGGLIRVGDIQIAVSERLIVKESALSSDLIDEINRGAFDPFSLYGMRLKPVSWATYCDKRVGLKKESVK